MSLTAEFEKNPITFLRNHALPPPDGMARGAVIKSWGGGSADIREGNNKGTISLTQSEMTRVFSSIQKHPILPGALTVSLSPTRTSADDFPKRH